MACGDLEHRNAAVMLAQMSAAHATLPTDVRGIACAPAPWSFAWHPALWQQICSAAAAVPAPVVQSAPLATVAVVPTQEPEPQPQATHSRSGTSSPNMSECSSRKRGNSQGSEASSPKMICSDDSRRQLNHHSGTQRRPLRDDYVTENEYLTAYSRWRQVRDRNNDAVKRSREKYKAKKKTNEVPPSTREVELEDQLESLKAKLALMARAYANQALSTTEREELKTIISTVSF